VPDLELRLPVSDESRPLYQVTVNDGGADGGSSASFAIGGGAGVVPTPTFDAAVQAFAAALAVPPAVIVSVTRISAAQTAL
jgi:hypothetical protein